MRANEGRRARIEGSVADLLAGRYVLFAAIVQPDGAPYATRGWGLTVLCHDPAEVRLVLPADDLAQLVTERGRRRVAMIAGDPRAMRAVQLKGWAGLPESPSEADREAVDRYREGFFSVIEDTDRTERRLLELLAPEDFIACTVEVEELFDQTPGPGAGAAMTSSSP